mmetsp:Transcript_86467/g.137252  ORF Transcript_86467/g.137252 Transcript_86467/m.137252 type:complete len:543 (-) Transcript_86467:306-1934(-)
MAFAAASDCLSGCVNGVCNLPELLRPGRERRERLWWMRASLPQGQDDALSPPRVEPETDGMTVSAPQLSCPGVISRSQSSEEKPSGSFAVETRAVESETGETVPVEAVKAVEMVAAVAAVAAEDTVEAVAAEEILEPVETEETVEARETLEAKDTVAAEETVESEETVDGEETVESEESVVAEETVEGEETIAAEEAVAAKVHVESEETVAAEEGVEAEVPVERPTLLTASKAVSPKSIRSQDGKLCTSPRFDGLEGPDGPDGSLSALTTATAFDATAFDEGSPVNAQALTCCIAGAPNSGNDWLWDASLAVGAASWTGAKHVASFLGNQIYEAAVLAQPHVQSMANSAADALKAAAEDSMGKIRALGPRTSGRSKLQRARASLALEPPHLQKPTLPPLPPLPELGSYTAQMGLYPAPFPALQPGTNRTLSLPLPTCSSFPTQAPMQSYGHMQSYHPGYQAYQSQAFRGYNHGYKVHSQGISYPQTFQGQLQPSYSFAHASLPRTSTFVPGIHHAHSFSVQETPLTGRRVPLAPSRIKSAAS